MNPCALCAGYGVRKPGRGGPSGGDLHRLLPRPRVRVHGNHATRLHGHLRCHQHHGLKGKRSYIFFVGEITEIRYSEILSPMD